MKKTFCAIVLAAAAVWAGAQHVPTFTDGEVELQGRAQLVASIGPWDVLAELLGRVHDLESLNTFESVTVGGYYRVIPNLKIGALFRAQAGARHDDDVIANFSTNEWNWSSEVRRRLEGVLMLDVSPRFKLDFLPGSNWVFMLKSRYLYNTWNGDMSILVRPELTWFWIVDRDPFLNISLSYEMYFPLNFGSSLIYQSYPYLTVLYHATPELGIEVGAAYKTTTWSTSKSWRDAAWDSYSTQVSSWAISLGVVYTPSF